MSDIVPWQDPRTDPHRPHPTIFATLLKSHVPNWLRAWWPAVLWAVVIFIMSTDTFSSEHTKWVFEPIIHWLLPSLTQQQIQAVHHFIRKSAHFTEYFIFCLLLFRGIRGARQGWRWTWGLTALSIAAGYSILDEVHQAFVASRTASPYDSLLDSVGAFGAFATLWLWFRIARVKARQTATGPELTKIIQQGVASKKGRPLGS